MEANSPTTLFDLLVWGGLLVSLTGLCGLIWCIVFIAKSKRQNLSDEDMRAQLRKAIPMNLASLFLAVIGLMLVIVGIFLQ